MHEMQRQWSVSAMRRFRLRVVQERERCLRLVQGNWKDLVHMPEDHLAHYSVARDDPRATSIFE